MTSPDSRAERDRLAQIYLDVQGMARALARPGAPSFMILLSKYVIDGEEYSATGLTVSPEATPNLRQTASGFECDASFLPDQLAPSSSQGKEIVNGEIVVRMTVYLRDIAQVIPLP
ncbi:hypothetical protein ACQP2X_39860 [Actinoplanes sp. CA-131856]